MNVLQRELPLCALVACTALITACTSPGYNNNPSQQNTNGTVGCLAATDFFAVYFSVHVQPSDASPDARISKERFRAYCNDIPIPGKVFFTADLVGNDLRRTPVGIRVVEQALDENEPHAESSKELRAISEVPAKTYANGVIESQFELDKSGSYAIYLTRGEAFSDGDQLRIPINVGADANAKPLMTRFVTLFGTASALALIGFVAFRCVRRRKAL